MGNATDDLDRFLRTDGLRILMEAGIRVRDLPNSKSRSGKLHGEISHPTSINAQKQKEVHHDEDGTADGTNHCEEKPGTILQLLPEPWLMIS